MNEGLDEEDIRSAALASLTRDCRSVCRGHGFTARHTDTCTDIVTNLYSSITERSSLADLITELQRELASASLDDRSAKLFTEYLGSGLLQHFSLYQSVATQPRIVIKREEEQLVEVLQPPVPFAQAIPYKVWEYEQRVSQIDEKVREMAESRQKEASDLRTQRKAMASQLQTIFLSDEDAISIRDRVREMIANSITTQAELTQKMLTHELEASQEHLAKDVEKASLPRPLPLGPLPLRPVQSRSTLRETRDLHSQLASRLTADTDNSSRKSAGKSRGGKK